MKNAKRIPADKMNELFPLLTPYVMENPELSDTYLDFEVGVAPATLSGLFETLAGKIVFPVRDEQGVLCGYAANTGELFCKGEVLYGLHKAKSAILETGSVFIVENCKDVLVMHAAGYTNTVGLCGMKITPGQIALLNKYTSYVKLIPGSNDEGVKAANKIKKKLGKKGFKCLTFKLPEGAVPDTFFRTVDRETFRLVIEQFLHMICLQERLFVAACVCFRDIVMKDDKEDLFYIPYLYTAMENEKLLPESPFNREIMRLLSEMTPLEDFPGELQEEVERMEKKLLFPFTIMDKGLSILQKEKDYMPGFEIVSLFFYLYLEYRLKFVISKLTRQLAYEEYPKKRKSLEKRLKRYQEDLEFFSTTLETIGFSLPDLIADASCRLDPEE